ncbi:hypothetical protein [Endozoicomonas sp.]|uniref:hypothetical protein n=1 Tax=Endozoicomonas sp. TaxID=1892382 RepID=UPI003AF43C8D
MIKQFAFADTRNRQSIGVSFERGNKDKGHGDQQSAGRPEYRFKLFVHDDVLKRRLALLQKEKASPKVVLFL